MKYKVLIDNIDKYTREEHKKGEIVQLTEERMLEINAVNSPYLEKVEEVIGEEIFNLNN